MVYMLYINIFQVSSHHVNRLAIETLKKYDLFRNCKVPLLFYVAHVKCVCTVYIPYR